jgi:GT2 family glycosyltransferase
MTPLTYIVIAVHSRGEYNTVPYLDECMRTLKENTENFRVIYVDDYCDREGGDAIERHASTFAESYVIRTHKQRWFTRANNLGLRLVRSPWVVLLNTDTVLGERWLEELYGVRDDVQGTGKRVGLVGSELSADEQRRYDIPRFPTTPGNPGYVTAHCYLANMQALYECSAARGMPGWYLDETQQPMIHIRSDNEICQRMNELGYETVRSFKAQVGHRGGASWGHDLGRISGLTLQQVNDY